MRFGWYYIRERGADYGREAEAVITYATEPSPETGHAGWCWRAERAAKVDAGQPEEQGT